MGYGWIRCALFHWFRSEIIACVVDVEFPFFFMASAAGAVSYRDLIPEPVSVVDKKGDPFVVNDRTKIVYPQDYVQWKRTAEFLAGYVEGMTGYRLPVEECRSSESEPVISSEDNVIRFQCDSRMRKDGFKLSVGKYGVVIQAADGAGIFMLSSYCGSCFFRGRNRYRRSGHKRNRYKRSKPLQRYRQRR